MTHQSSLRALFSVTPLALVGACHTATEPIVKGTTFVLETIDGAPLPAASGSSPTAGMVIADTLIFLTSAGKASGQFEHLETTVSGPYTPEHSYYGSYDWHFGRISMSWSPCPFGGIL